MVEELSYLGVRKKCEEDFLQCTSTAELDPLKQIIGQDRALRSLQFGLDIQEKGFNIFVAGMPGTGRKTAITGFLEERAKDMPTPPDWCYVNNFEDPNSPNAMKMPAGMGGKFRDDMDLFVEEMKTALKTAFESDDYSQRREETLNQYEEKRNNLLKELNNKANQAGFALQRSQIGMLIIPVINGQMINEQQFSILPASLQQEIQVRRRKLQEEMRSSLRQFRDIDREAQEAIESFNKEVASYAIDDIIISLKDKYGDIDEVTQFLEEVKKDLLNNLATILTTGEQQTQLPFMMPQAPDPTIRYRVNLIVDNSKLQGAPVIMELNPSYSHLFGMVEKEARFGALFTDYTMIRAGSAHEANGGYLIIPVEDLFRNPGSWESLKRTILNEKIEIEEIAQRMGFLTTKSLRPEPIPFDAKVVLVGNAQVYNILYTMERDFPKIFKVKADFDSTMERNKENVQQYAAFMCTLAIKENLKHLDPSGIAEVVEHGSRLARDQEKLSTQFSDVADIIREANFYAQQENAEHISAKHIRRALEEKIYRSNLIQEKLEEMIERGTILVDTDGERIGQVNGLAVLGLGDYMFGKPSRITVSIGVGKEGIIDIEREAEMGGPTHTKGVHILSGFLTNRYADDQPLSITARIVFEQSYSGVDGDSASSTETYAIMSALSGVPIKQQFAVTGSVNQKGEVQAIGGVNEKIEGFFELCKARGLTGKQGVVIPESNVKNLMLKPELVDTIKKGDFHVYPIKSIDEGIEVLTGVPAGERQADGTWPKDTINYLAHMKVKELAQKAKEYSD